jgi:hypothetical protein
MLIQSKFQSMNARKLLTLTAILLFVTSSVFSQRVFDLQENNTTNADGVEIGFTITNEQKKEIGNETYARYEVTVYISNHSGCHRFFLDEGIGNVFGGSYASPGTIAIFDCINATGKRLTSKNVSVRAKPFYLNGSFSDTKDGKTVTRTIRVQSGYILRNGDSVSNNLIIIVPLGERPIFKCRMMNQSNI